MDGIDPDTLLEWLQTGVGDERDLQLMALEQLCMLLLMSDNIDRCFESCPPRSFLPALGRIFLDETAPENILEVTARAITYYLDVSNECTRRVTQVDGAVKAICNRLVMAEMSNRTSKDLAEQCVKLLEHICQREASVVYEAGGLQSMLHLVCQHDSVIHKDTMHSAMSVITRLCSRVDLQDTNLLKCSSNLGILLSHDDPKIAECALRCFAVLTDRFLRKSLDPVELALPSNLVEHLLNSLVPSCSTTIDTKSEDGGCEKKTVSTMKNRSPAFISIVLSLLSNLCRGSSAVTNQVICSPKLIHALRVVLSSKDERCVMDGLRLADLLVVLLCEGRVLLPKIATTQLTTSSAPVSSSNLDKTHRHLIDAIRQRDTDALIDAVENGSVDSNFIDDVGQTLLNWCAAFGTPDMVMYLCDKGADPNKGQRSSSLHYAACFGRPEIIKILLQYGGNPDLHDEEGRTALDKARERNDEGHQQVVQILESPGTYVTINNSRRNRDQNDECNQTVEKDACSEVSRTDFAQDDKKSSQIREILQQLVAIACTVFQNSLVNSMRRSALSLIRKCIDHLSSEGIFELINGSVNPYQMSRQSECYDFVENLMGVLVTVFNNEDNVEGKEQALLIMKSLLEKDTSFWLDQLIRLGVYEKVEKFSTGGEEVEPQVSTSKENIETTEKFSLHQEGILSENSAVKAEQSEIIASSPFFDGSDNKSENRSVSSTPSITSLSIKLDAENSASTLANRAQDASSERYQMLNIPVESDETANGEATTTPSPTVELEDQKRSSPSRPALNNTSSSGRLSSQFASVRADLVEAATAVAQALGVQIVDDSPGTSLLSSSINTVGELASDGGNLTLHGGLTTKKSAAEDVWKLTGGAFYKWNDWRLVRYKDSFFLWCDAVAIEFSDGSNGWLRFLMDGKLTTMYSNGNPQVGGDDSVSRAEFVAKFLRAKNCIPTGIQTRTIFTNPHASRKIDSGNWQIGCIESGQLIITNQEGGEQRLIIKEDLPGFVFETTKSNAQCFSAESTLGLDFVTGWAARGGGRRLRYRAETQRQKLHELAKELWDNYLKEAKTKPRDALVQLQQNASTIAFLTEKIYRLMSNNEENSKLLNNSSTLEDDSSNLTKALRNVRDALSNERLLSTFEISVSNVVSALLKLLKYAFEENCEMLAKCFLETFSNVRDLSVLVRKMVLVLESAEKFSQQLYDAPGGSSFGLQLLTRRFKFRMELADPDHERQKTFYNYSNRTMKSEPLAIVGALRQHLLGLVVKQWYDYPRELLAFVKQLKEMKERNEKLELTYESDFDTNGLIWYLGTNGRTNSEWTNPALIRVLNVCYADGARLLYGQPEDLLSRDVMPLNCQTADMPDANFTMDLGVWLFPTAYTLRQAQNYEKSSLRNWFLQASKDNFVWDVIMVHSNDTLLNEAGSTATWHMDAEDTKKGPYRYFRIAQNGKNSASLYSMSLSGFEIYGQVVDVVDTELKNLEVQSSNLTKLTSKSTLISSLTLGSKKQKQKSTGATAAASSMSGSSDGSSNAKGVTNYSPPPTTSSIRHTRKQQKLQKTGGGGGTSGSAENDRQTARTTSSSNTTGFEFKLSDIGANFDSELFKQLTGSGASKLRMLRYHRNGRSHQHSLSNNAQTHGVVEPTSESQNNAENEDKDGLPPAPPSSTPMLKLGTRVVPGQDWPWSNQNHNLVGTIVGVGKTAGGWVDVQWDDGTSNAYRFGHSGKYDVEPLDESNSKTILSSYQRGKIFRMKSGLSPSSKQFQPIGSEKKAAAANKHSTDKTGGRLSLEARRASNLDAIEDEEQILERQSSADYQQNQKTISTAVTTLLGGSNTTTSISQKSMSATNLFDDRQRQGHQQHSVASTNQAASAESLQHHTPSLENLLARSRIYADRIPEVVGDEQQSPNGTPEPRAYGSEETCQKSETNLPIMTSSASVAASTFAGGSQPVLSQSNRICFNGDSSEERFGSSVNTVVSEDADDKLATKPSENESGNNERDGHTSVSVTVLGGSSSEKHNQDEEESASKSVSEPQLAFSQQSSSSSSIQYVDAEAPPSTSNNNLAIVEVATSSSDEAYQHAHHQIDARSVDGGDGSDASSTLLLSTPPPTSSVTASNLGGNMGGSIRLKLGNYAEVLRGMMQQVIDSSGIIGNGAGVFGDDELGNDIFDDELLGQSFIEDNCDVASLVDGFNQHFSIDSLSSAAAILRRQLSSSNGGGSHITMGFNDVPSASNGEAAAVVTVDDSARRKFSVTRRAANNSESSVAATATTAADERLTWRQMFMCSAEDERMMAPLPPPTQRVHHHTYPHDESANHQHKSSLRVTSTEINGDSASCCAALRREHSNSRRDNMTRVWDDEYVLRRQFGALIPAFDPRPGRTNVNQTQEVELTDETNSVTYNRRGSLLRQVFGGKLGGRSIDSGSSKIRLYLKGPNLGGVESEVIEMQDDCASVFYYIQKLASLATWNSGSAGEYKSEKNRRIWEPVYTVIYEALCVGDDNEPVPPPSCVAKLLGKTASKENANDEFAGLINEALNVIKLLNSISSRHQIDLADEVFESTKITQKLTQCLTDPLIVSASALPDWCNHLIYNYPCLFSTDTRSMHLRATAFGTSRAIAWLQSRRDQLLEQNRSAGGSASGSNLAGSRREDHYPEFRVGRIKHERIKVHRDDDLLLENAMRVLKFHAMRKAVLEIEYYAEEGTGLGPTLEFYALLSAEFQRKSLKMWLCDDSDEQQSLLEADSLDLGEGEKPPGYYIRRSNGLFPAFMPHWTDECAKVTSYFNVFGIFIAKVIQDSRLVDIPLSVTFLKLILSPKVCGNEPASLEGVLTMDDLAQIHFPKATFLRALQRFVDERRLILNSETLNETEKSVALASLNLKLADGTKCRVEDLTLSFVLNPPSAIFDYDEIELMENGAEVAVTSENVDDYVEKCLSVYLNTGIRQQVLAFREGFDSVFPLKSLCSFAPEELQTLISGDRSPQWSRDDLLKYTEPKLGYARDSIGFLHLVDVLVQMTATERKAFLQFTTGCSSLPPGGLANLHPRLTVVRKVGAGDGSYPSVNTCVHYLKLPEYSSAAILRERLIAATFEKGFHLN